MPADGSASTNGCGAAVHDRRLGRVELDLEVVDPASRHRGKHVFHRMHRERILAELRVPLGEHRALGERRDGRRAREIGAHERRCPAPLARGTER